LIIFYSPVLTIVTLATVLFYTGYVVCDEFCFVLLSTCYIPLANKIGRAKRVFGSRRVTAAASRGLAEGQRRSVGA